MKNLIYLMIFSFALTPRIYGADPNVDKIIKQSDEARAPLGDHSVTVQVIDSDGTDEKKSTFKVKIKDSNLCLVEQIEPVRQQGRKLLMRDYDLWLYTPNISRPTRISFEQKLTGEVANGDLMRTNFSADYDGKLLATEKIDGVEAYKIHLTAKTKDVTYRSIDYWVDTKKILPIKAVFNAASGKPMKVATYHDFKPHLGKPRFTRAVITDLLQKKRVSQLRYFKYKKEKFALSVFSKESLGQ